MISVPTGRLQIDSALRAFVDKEAIPGTGIAPEAFWAGFEEIVAELMPRNRHLLARRAELQSDMDGWHLRHPGRIADPAAYERFLTETGYLLPEPEAFTVDNGEIDPEIASVAGPQLVVPATNARYALNAANARWGSLYNTLYGTNAIPETGGADRSEAFNPVRGRRVVEYVRGFLDRMVPLARGSYADVASYRIDGAKLLVRLQDDTTTGPTDPAAFAGYRGDPAAPSAILLVHHGLHIELVIDRSRQIGKTDPAGVADVEIESALSTIIDGEDSVTAVDTADKIGLYRNWLGLMKGTLTAQFRKNGKAIERALAPDRTYTAPDGTTLTLHGRSLLLIRNVGHHMMTDIVRTDSGEDIPETLLDAAVTTLIALYDLRGSQALRNSRAGAIYVVRPKMHSPDEVALSVALFEKLERLFGLKAGTIKIGIMDEERRLSLNLRAAIHAARERVFFINTGFLDRTGDEIHSIMEAGPVVTKTAMRSETWIKAYERNNVQAGLETGLNTRGQIGKGMWTSPDLMAEMLTQKIAHPEAGASTAWVPSPTAATLHALHYHMCDVRARQRELYAGRPAPRRDLLALPLHPAPESLSEDEIRAELENNIQSILGYVVRWIDHGIGCSKVPDIHGTGLMEDRATLRISSQHVANWLHHGVASPQLVDDILKRMAAVVDRQNANDPTYTPMAPGFDGPAFQAARELIFSGRSQPQGYTEFILHAWRREKKVLAGGETPEAP